MPPDTLYSPILYRFFYLLTPPTEIPPLPQSLHKDPEAHNVMEPSSRNPSYFPIHLYTILQVVITVVIFIVTLTRAAPVFPVLIIALVPFRLLVMKKWWPREVLRFVDAWACREGTPEDDEDAAKLDGLPTQETSSGDENVTPGRVFRHNTNGDDNGSSYVGERSTSNADSRADLGDQTIRRAAHDVNHEWVELEEREVPDEELGRDR
jgi:hypothetical protein